MPIKFNPKQLKDVAKHIRTSFLNSQTRITNEYLLLESIISRLEEGSPEHDLAVEIYNKHAEILKVMRPNNFIDEEV